jgi:hypothetical protein
MPSFTETNNMFYCLKEKKKLVLVCVSLFTKMFMLGFHLAKYAVLQRFLLFGTKYVLACVSIDNCLNLSYRWGTLHLLKFSARASSCKGPFLCLLIY